MGLVGATVPTLSAYAAESTFNFNRIEPAPSANAARRTVFVSKTNASLAAAWVNPVGTFTSTTFFLENQESGRQSVGALSMSTGGRRNFTWNAGQGANGSRHRLVGMAANITNQNSYQVQGTWRP